MFSLLVPIDVWANGIDHQVAFRLSSPFAYLIHTSGTSRTGGMGMPVRIQHKQLKENVQAIGYVFTPVPAMVLRVASIQCCPQNGGLDLGKQTLILSLLRISVHVGHEGMRLVWKHSTIRIFQSRILPRLILPWWTLYYPFGMEVVLCSFPPQCWWCLSRSGPSLPLYPPPWSF